MLDGQHRSTTNSIEKFSAHFAEQLSLIQDISSDFYKKVLLLGVLDSLSRAAFPCNNGHHNRMIQLIDECSGWNHKDHVSSQQLRLLLEEGGHTNTPLYQKATQQVASWGEGQIINPGDDLQYNDIVGIAEDNERNLLRQATYKELLYVYRNHVIHEFREPGHGMELYENKDCPYYHHDENNDWQLVFPVGFFKNLSANCLNNVSCYMSIRGIDPYSSYQFGTLWRRRQLK
jgi:hypothetical protein